MSIVLSWVFAKHCYFICIVLIRHSCIPFKCCTIFFLWFQIYFILSSYHIFIPKDTTNVAKSNLFNSQNFALFVPIDVLEVELVTFRLGHDEVPAFICLSLLIYIYIYIYILYKRLHLIFNERNIFNIFHRNDDEFYDMLEDVKVYNSLISIL